MRTLICRWGRRESWCWSPPYVAFLVDFVYRVLGVSCLLWVESKRLHSVQASIRWIEFLESDLREHGRLPEVDRRGPATQPRSQARGAEDDGRWQRWTVDFNSRLLAGRRRGGGCRRRRSFPWPPLSSRRCHLSLGMVTALRWETISDRIKDIKKKIYIYIYIPYLVIWVVCTWWCYSILKCRSGFIIFHLAAVIFGVTCSLFWGFVLIIQRSLEKSLVFVWFPQVTTLLTCTRRLKTRGTDLTTSRLSNVPRNKYSTTRTVVKDTCSSTWMSTSVFFSSFTNLIIT